MDQGLAATIQDPAVDPPALARALAGLGEVDEPATFWQVIIADAGYPAPHRAAAVCYLLARHGWPGMTLADLSDLLQAAHWLAEEDVVAIPWLMGELPVRWSDDDSYFAVGPFGGQMPEGSERTTIYLRIRGRVDAQTLRAGLSADSGADGAGQHAVIEIGFAGPAVPGPVRSGP